MKIHLLLALLFSLNVSFALAQEAALAKETVAAKETPTLKFFELRTYYTNEGKLDELHARFRDHTCEFFNSHGMTNIGYWVPQGEPETLIYLLGYPSREARAASWDAFLKDPKWQAAYKASTADGKLVKKIDSLFLAPTDYSKLAKLKRQEKDQLFELRIYTTNEGKLDGLNARFRGHTCELFEKHGITNFAYFTPTEEKNGSANKLVYLVSHQDEIKRGESFKAFSQDARWKTARAESEEGGRILVKKGIKSTLLTPTDYSPVN